MKKTLAVTTFAVVIVIIAMARKAKMELKIPGLNNKEIKAYHYLLALQDIAQLCDIDITAKADIIRNYLETIKTAYCSCGKWFLAGTENSHRDDYCTTLIHHIKFADKNTFDSQIEEWEIFRTEYARNSKTELTMTDAINLHYFSTHLNEG